jgi:ubiquinone/menaquinone biosynthesis C-methylase UbiE
MGSLVNLVTPLHKQTSRDYLARMVDDKVHCMEVSRQYGPEYWDGDRRYGYGGYQYDGRWKPLAEQVIERYGLTNQSRILDVGCGKAHLLYEIHKLLPGATLKGFDISQYGLNSAPNELFPFLSIGRAEDVRSYQYPDKSFDLVWSNLALHNLKRYELPTALREIERVGRQAYICVESYRNAQEQFNLQCWALTCWAFYDTNEWVSAFQEYGYRGDYEFVFFE